jgi:mycothiol synthase
MTAGLPEGFTTRPSVMDDLEETVALYNAWSQDILAVDRYDIDRERIDWQAPGFNLATDTRTVLSPEGRIAAQGLVWDVDEPHVQAHSFGRVHPDYRGLGIGSWLISWEEERAREAIRRAPDHARVAISQTTAERDKTSQALFRQHGYEVARHFWKMEISFAERLSEPQLPTGIALRPFDPASDLTSSLLAVRDAFKDHWGFVETPFDEELKQWRHWIEADPQFDPTLWFLAMDGDEIAGLVLCQKKHAEDPQTGWIEILGVRRPWRHRGLGLALLHHAFRELAARGKRKAGLGVDSTSLTGATRLYERAGMHIARQDDLYEKVLRPGEDLRRTA